MAETRWLDDDEQQAWRAFLSATQLLFEAVEGQLQHDAGLSHGDFEILVKLSEAPGRRLRMSQLARTLLFSRSRLSHAVTRLERLGWVLREECAGDKRGTVAALTDAGFAILAGAAPGHVECVRTHLFDQLTREQVRQLHEISAVLRDHLQHPVTAKVA